MKCFRRLRQLNKWGRAAFTAALLIEMLLVAAGVLLVWLPASALPFLLATEIAAFVPLDGLLLYWLEKRRQEKLEKESQAELKAFLLKQRTLRHDFNIHLMALSGLLEAGRYEELGQYLREMLDASQEVSQLMPLDDPAVSAMLSHMISDAKKRDIQIKCFVYYDCSGVSCDAYELNMILGNLIRNSCEAVELLPPELRKVTVTILQRRSQCILRVENPLSKGTVLDERIFQAGYSSKKGHTGIGLASVHKQANALGGTFFMEQEDETVSMIVQLPLEK